MKTPYRPHIGAHVIPARPSDVRRLLEGLDADALGALDPSLGEWMNRPLGREILASTVLPAAGSVYVCLYSLEPAGLIVVERGRRGARVRALAVAADMRRRGVARALLREAVSRARERGLSFVWMRVSSANRAAIDGALSLDFRRVLPQHVRRELTTPIPVTADRARVAVRESDSVTMAQWHAIESEAGDAWVWSLIEADLAQHILPQGGRILAIAADGEDVGCAHIEHASERTRVHVWLAPKLWNTPQEIICLRAALDAIGDPPRVLDVYLGSAGHLKLAAARYKALGFKPVLNAWQFLAAPV